MNLHTTYIRLEFAVDLFVSIHTDREHRQQVTNVRTLWYMNGELYGHVRVLKSAHALHRKKLRDGKSNCTTESLHNIFYLVSQFSSCLCVVAFFGSPHSSFNRILPAVHKDNNDSNTTRHIQNIFFISFLKKKSV